MKATGDRLHALPLSERFDRFLQYYLSAEHRDHPEQGCPILPLIYEVSLAPKEFREEFTRDLESTLRDRLREFDLGNSEEAFENLLSTYASLMGAQLLARATRGTDFSEKILLSTMRNIKK
jgi:TetR/AcrR family transcriptional repressor of nem operon